MRDTIGNEFSIGKVKGEGSDGPAPASRIQTRTVERTMSQVMPLPPTIAETRARSRGIRLWNARQIRTFLRYGSLYRVPITADTVAPLATRYAEKHATTRPRRLAQFR